MLDHIQAQKLKDKFSPEYPIMLFPLRVETRFIKTQSSDDKGIGIDPSIAQTTALAQTLIRATEEGNDNMDLLDKAIGIIQQHFANIQEEQSVEGYEPTSIAKWKITMADTLLDIHGGNLIAKFRKTWQDSMIKNQESNVIIQQVKELSFEEDGEAVLLDERLTKALAQDFNYLKAETKDVKALKKFTGQGLYIEQERISLTLQTIYTVISGFNQLHPEDWGRMQDWLEIIETVEFWNEQALIALTEYEGYLTQRTESIQNIQLYFKNTYQQQLESETFNPYLRNWKQIIEIKERFSLFDTAQNKFQFQAGFSQLNQLKDLWENIKNEGLQAEGIDDYTQAEFSLFEQSVESYIRVLNKKKTSYKAQLNLYSNRINKCYDYFLESTESGIILEAGNQNVETWVSIASNLETTIYHLVFNEKELDFDKVLEEVKVLSDLFFQLSFQLIPCNIEGGLENSTLQEWLPKLQTSFEQLTVFINHKEVLLTTQFEQQRTFLSTVAQTTRSIQNESFEEVPYIKLWQHLQENTLQVKEGDDFLKIEASLRTISEEYKRAFTELAENQHFATAGLVAKNENLLFDIDLEYQVLQEQYNTWKSFLQNSQNKLQELTWEINNDSSAISIDVKASLRFWEDKLTVLTSESFHSTELNDATKNIFEIYQIIFVTLRNIKFVNEVDVNLFNEILGNVASKLELWREQVNSKLQQIEVENLERQSIRESIQGNLNIIKEEVNVDELCTLWLQKHRIASSWTQRISSSIDSSFQKNIFETAQSNFEQLIAYRESVSIPSLEYNNELFKGVKDLKTDLTQYITVYQSHYNTLNALHLSIQEVQVGINELLSNRVSPLEAEKDELGEAKVLELINLANQRLEWLSLKQPASILLDGYQELRQIYQQIRLHVQFLDVIPQEVSILPNSIESLKSTYEEWHQLFLEELTQSFNDVESAVQTLETITKQSEELAVYSATDFDQGGTISAALFNPINTTTGGIICQFPLFPITDPGGGGTGGGGTTPDPVILQEHELWIRVYPDYAAITSHEPKLTPSEVQGGVDFWMDYWFAVDNRTLEVGAWRVLVDKFGAQRAAWIAKVMRPLNINQKPSTSISISDQLYTFVQEELAEEHIIGGLAYWEQAIIQKNNPEQLAILRTNLETNYPKGRAAVLTTITKLPSISKAYNPLNQSDKLDLGSKNISASIINAVVNKASQIQLQQQILSVPTVLPLFPVLDPSKDIKSKAWESAPFTNILPDQLVFMLYDNDGNLKYEEVGELIPATIQTGPDPNDLSQFDPTLSDLGVDGAIKWMTDFQEAVDKGMAIRIPVLNEESDPSLADAGFSKVFVLGVKHFDEENPTNDNINTFQNDSVDLLEQLFEGHHYTQGGLSILKPGTPTNTTSEYRSPFATQESIEDSFDREIIESLPSHTPLKDTSDGALIAKLLGINTKTFESIENNSFESITNVEHINTALWMTTWGYFLEELDNSDEVLSNEKEPIIPQNTIDALKDYFVTSVKGRGSLPTIRIGKQPYGILPTSSFHPTATEGGGWAWNDIVTGNKIHGVDEAAFYNNLTAILLEHFWGYRSQGTNLNKSKKWIQIVDEEIHTVDDPVLQNGVPATFSDGLTATQERFMEILRLHPHSVEFYNRYGVTIGSTLDDALSGQTATLSTLDAFSGWLGFNRSFGGEFSNFYLDPSSTTQVSLAHSLLANIRLLNPVVDELSVEIAPLEGPVIDDKLKSKDNRTLSNIDGSTINYIEWLLQADPTSLYNASKTHTEPSKSLLYQSLKNALFNQYWDACARILEDTKLYPLEPRFKDLMFRHNSSSLVASNDTHIVYQSADNLGQPNNLNFKFSVDRFFYRERYREFVIDVSDTLKGSFPRDPLFADELVFANGKWPIMSMLIKAQELKGLNQDQRLIDFVRQGVNNPSATVRQEYPEAMTGLLQFRASLAVLAQLPTAELEHLFAEHLDLASHRLDAWVLGLVNQRLSKMRSAQTEGIYLGAYGWLLNLKPGSKRQESHGGSTYHVKADGSIPEMIDPDNQGHILAPSLNHALTGAVLRSGYNAHLGGAEEGTLAINLSSKRIRKALFYLEGIRNGQPLGALLGYQLERALISNGLGQYIQAIREQFPLNKIATLSTFSQTDLHHTIDGEALLEVARTVGYPYGVSTLSPLPNSTKDLIISQIETLFNAIDALGDLAIAEGTYHVVSGNYARAGAMLKALSQQNHIPEPEVIQTPRTGQSLTHRVGIVIPPITTLNASPQWSSQLSTRAITEPSINRWLAEQLPNPENIKCQLNYKIEDAAGVVSSGRSTVSISDLEIEPIDLFYIFPESVLQINTELEKRFKKYLINQLNASASGLTYSKFVVDFATRDVSWANTVLTIEEISNLMYSLRAMLLKGRPITAIDVIHSSTDSGGDEFNLNLIEVQQRIQQLQTIFVAHQSQLQNNFQSLWLTALDGFESGDLTIEEDLSLIVDYTDIQSRLDKDYSRRLEEYQKVLTKIKPTQNNKKQFLLYQEAAQALLGKSFRILPHFSAHNAQELQSCYSARNTILPNVQPLEIEGWIMGLSRVKESMNHLEQFSLMQSILGGQDEMGLSFAPLQLPYRSNDNWVGMELPLDYYKNHQNDSAFVSLDKLSLVLAFPDSFSSHNPLAGIIIDEWTESIPNQEETIGVAFHYDEPNAEPPQAILLAIHPETIKNGGKKWHWNQLKDTLHTTLALAKMRAVEPDHLQCAQDTINTPFDAYAQLLPATYTRLQGNTLKGDWYTDYGLNNDSPIYSPLVIPPINHEPTISTTTLNSLNTKLKK